MASPDTTRSQTPPIPVAADALEQLVASSTKNYFSHVSALRYFCGGQECYPPYPNFPCHRNPAHFFADIENRTKTQWDEEGRIELVKQYCLGPARDAIDTIITETGHDYEDIKKVFLMSYPDTEDPDQYREILSTAKRKLGETIREF